MRKKSTRLLSAALAVCMMLSAPAGGRVCGGPGRQNRKMACAGGCCCAGGVYCNQRENFPDKNFRDYVAGKWDENHDNRFSLRDRERKVGFLDNKEISNLKGIEFLRTSGSSSAIIII